MARKRKPTKITLMSLVVPKNYPSDFQIGKVVGMSRFDLTDIGPLLHIQDIISGKMVESFPRYVDKLVRAV
jgi:hypothetical protein